MRLTLLLSAPLSWLSLPGWEPTTPLLHTGSALSSYFATLRGCRACGWVGATTQLPPCRGKRHLDRPARAHFPEFRGLYRPATVAAVEWKRLVLYSSFQVFLLHLLRRTQLLGAHCSVTLHAAVSGEFDGLKLSFPSYFLRGTRRAYNSGDISTTIH
ncbi:hypothetical protein ABZP36_000077 [Zizania latifolia]